MPIAIQDILETLCPRVSILSRNGTQAIFSLSPAHAAQLAYDLLAAHGIDVRIYPENGAAKLYVAEGTPEKKLESALRYAVTLKSLLGAMANAGSEYKIAFVNTPDQGKQISIVFPPPPGEKPVSSPAPAKPAAARPDLAPAYSNQRRPNKNWRRGKSKDEVLAAGPALARQYPFGAKPPTDAEPGLGKWISTIIFGNFSEGFYAFFGVFFFLLVAISIAVTVKSFLCPDLAVVKSKAWYCTLGGNE